MKFRVTNLVVSMAALLAAGSSFAERSQQAQQYGKVTDYIGVGSELNIIRPIEFGEGNWKVFICGGNAYKESDIKVKECTKKELEICTVSLPSSNHAAMGTEITIGANKVARVSQAPISKIGDQKAVTSISLVSSTVFNYFLSCARRGSSYYNDWTIDQLFNSPLPMTKETVDQLVGRYFTVKKVEPADVEKVQKIEIKGKAPKKFQKQEPNHMDSARPGA